MRGYLLKRLGLTLLTLLLVSIIVFAVAQILPGDIGRTVLGPFATNAQVEAYDHAIGADQALPVRYGQWLVNFVQGDWGESALLHTAVRPLVLTRLWHSLALGVFAMIFIIPFSIGMGVLAALRRNRATDRIISVTGLSLIALPEFVAGVVVLVIFAVQLGWFPTSSSVPRLSVVDVFRQFVLPAIPLMLVLFGYVARMARAGTIDALEANYTRTAVLKGLPFGAVLRRHVLRNSLLPTITVVAAQFGYLVGGLVVIETLFSYPGIGGLLLDSAKGHDLSVLESAVLMVAVVYMVANLLADLLYAKLNPRVRMAEA